MKELQEVINDVNNIKEAWLHKRQKLETTETKAPQKPE
jgi:regulator of sigma D